MRRTSEEWIQWARLHSEGEGVDDTWRELESFLSTIVGENEQLKSERNEAWIKLSAHHKWDCLSEIDCRICRRV